MTRQSFGARLTTSIGAHGSLCVGLDPHRDLLLQWGLPDNAAGLAQLCDVVLDAVAGRVAAVKPQSAFFERHAR